MKFEPPATPAPVRGGVLIGGDSSRMGRPKWSLEYRGKSLLQRAVDVLRTIDARPTILGGESEMTGFDLPHLADLPGAEGPLAGVSAAMREDEDAAWLILACDLPYFGIDALQWILSQRKPDAWAVLPRALGRLQPLGALYEPRAGTLVLGQMRTRDFAAHHLATRAGCWTPTAPSSLERAWTNVNTPEEWAKVSPDGPHHE